MKVLKPPAADTVEIVEIEEAKETAVEDVKEAVKKDADGTEFPGVDMVFPMKDFGDNLEAWAGSVKTVLTAAHQKDVEKVRLKAMNGCSACRHTSCRVCSWPKAVRYWRKVETGSRFAKEEGYLKSMKSKTGMKVDD